MTKKAVQLDSDDYDIKNPFRRFEVITTSTNLISLGYFDTAVRFRFRRGSDEITASPWKESLNNVRVRLTPTGPKITAINNGKLPSPPSDVAYTKPIKFRALIGTQDCFNSLGQALLTMKFDRPEEALAQIVVQDRANFYKFGKADKEDEPCEWFRDGDNRVGVLNLNVVVSPRNWRAEASRTIMDVEVKGRDLRITLSPVTP